MSKPKMGNRFLRTLFLTTISSALMFAGYCEADEMLDGMMMLPGYGVIPSGPTPEEQKGPTDPHNQSVTPGVTGLLSKVAWPATWSFLKGLKFFLENFIGQTFPCTIWQWVPLRVECSPMA